jgi:hypothetical protein
MSARWTHEARGGMMLVSLGAIVLLVGLSGGGCILLGRNCS